MYMAAIGHVHGNLPALTAVLDALDDEGILTVLNTGDSVGGSMSNEIVEVLRERNVLSVLEEADRRVVHFLRKRATLQKKCSPEEFAALEQAFESLHPENIEYLRSLPRSKTYEFEGIHILLCSGTPSNPAGTLSEDDSEDMFRRQREIANADIIIGGGTHDAYARTVDGTLFVSPGACGQEHIATYALIDTEVQPWTVRFCETKY